MLKTRNPSTIAAPAAKYSHSVEVPPNARWLFTAGQVGVRPDGSIPEGSEAQHDQIWQNQLATHAGDRYRPAPTACEEPERAPISRRGLLEHAKQGGDADATCNHHHSLACVIEREAAVRPVDRNLGPGFDLTEVARAISGLSDDEPESGELARC